MKLSAASSHMTESVAFFEEIEFNELEVLEISFFQWQGHYEINAYNVARDTLNKMFSYNACICVTTIAIRCCSSTIRNSTIVSLT